LSCLLSIQDLRTYLYTRDGIVRAVDGVDLELEEGETLGIVGESGCGKSMTALSVMRLIPAHQGRIVSGKIVFKGHDLATLPEEEMRRIRGTRISIIFQEPMTALNPLLTIGTQIREMLQIHLDMKKGEAETRSLELLNLVGISLPGRRIKEYPHQLSGGMRQRVMIAIAISCRPDIIFADEPTTALDVTIQAQILDLLGRLRKEFGMSMVLISHDLGVIAEVADHVAVMYAGRIVEYAGTEELFGSPLHPYTKGLLGSIPRFDRDGGKIKRLYGIPGMVPRLSDLPSGCKFQTRCPIVVDRCRVDEPQLVELFKGHKARCWLAG
jgi:peptide/nickel transport system ATP-binding protein/oligopeptide transport system ATP-binding protein